MTAIAHHPHRASTAVTHARTALAGVAEVPVWSMDAGETTSTLSELHHSRAHDPTYTMTRLHTGTYGFHRRT